MFLLKALGIRALDDADGISMVALCHFNFAGETIRKQYFVHNIQCVNCDDSGGVDCISKFVRLYAVLSLSGLH